MDILNNMSENEIVEYIKTDKKDIWNFNIKNKSYQINFFMYCLLNKLTRYCNEFFKRKDLLEHINDKTRDNVTPLLSACISNDIRLVKKIMNVKGIDVSLLKNLPTCDISYDIIVYLCQYEKFDLNIEIDVYGKALPLYKAFFELYMEDGILNILKNKSFDVNIIYEDVLSYFNEKFSIPNQTQEIFDMCIKHPKFILNDEKIRLTIDSGKNYCITQLENLAKRKI